MSGSKSTPIALITSSPLDRPIQLSKRKLEVDAPTEHVSSLTGAPKKPKRPNRNPKKHPKLWLPEGSVVIEVGNIQFRLHKSRLEQHSEYFTSLFTLKQHGESKLDGTLPLYFVHLTSASDFEALLFALEDAMYVYFFTLFSSLLTASMDNSTYHIQPPPFRTVSSILRASSALAFPKFRHWAIMYLENMWSDDLDDLRATSRLPDATEAVILGRNYDVPSILKRAFYELLRSGGFALKDELDPETKHHTDSKNWKDDKSDILISRADLRRLIVVREKLTSAWILATASAPKFPECSLSEKHGSKEKGSSSPDGCSSASAKRSGWTRVVHESGMFEKYLYDPICGLDALCDIPWMKQEHYCKECFSARRNAWDKQREALWSDLGSWLAL